MKVIARVLGTAVVLSCTLGLFGAGPASAASLDLHRGSHGGQVLRLEARLNELQLLRRSAVDRDYRLRTVYAVKGFQRGHGLRVTGRTDERTWNEVYYAVLRKRSAAPLILGHRGAVLPSVPENTMASMRYALSSADVLEFDLRLTADRVFVLMHDAALDRTTDCSGAVELKTLQELRAECDVSGEPIPTLDEVAAFAAANDAAIAPELKVSSLTDEDLARFTNILDSDGLTDRTFVQSFDPSLFPRLRALDPRLVLVYLTAPTTDPNVVTAAGAAVAGLNSHGLTAAIVAAYQRAGLEVWAWTPSTAAELSSLWAMRVDGVFTDIPVAARAIFGAAA